jgi:hypothetical protein
MGPQSKRGVKKSEKKTNEHYYKGRFLNTHKVPFMLFFAIIPSLLHFKDDCIIFLIIMIT